MAEEPPRQQITFQFFLRRVIEQAAELTRRIDPKKRYRQEKVQLVALTAITIGFCLAAGYIIYGIGK